MPKQPRDPDNIYERIKREVRCEKVFDFLGLQMKPWNSSTVGAQYRGPCPVCNRGGDRILAYTIAEKSWCCHSPVCSPKGGRTKGGDIIGLVAHVKGIGNYDAALLLQDAFLREPEKPKASKSSQRRTAKPRAASNAPKVPTNRRRNSNKIVDAPVGGTGDAYSIVDYLEQFS